MAKPAVSVVMSVYNAEAYLKTSIKSILAQTLHNIEFIIINDGSTDCSKSILTRIAQQDKRVKVVNHARNLGLIAGLNHGIELARSEYIARQDADDISKPNRLEKQLAFLRANPKIGLVGTNYDVIDQSGVSVDATNVFTKPNDLRLAQIFTNQFGHGTIMAKAELLSQNRYDPAFKHAEDFDLWSRLARQTELANLKESLYQWRLHKAGVTVSRSKEMETQVKRVSQREFNFILNGPRQPRLLFLSPLSLRGSPTIYMSKKSRLYRDLALMYARHGRRLESYKALLIALAHAPLAARNYQYFSVFLFNRQRLKDLEIEAV